MLTANVTRLLASLGLSLAGVLAIFVAFSKDQRNIGELKHAAKVGKNNAIVQNNGQRGAGNRGKPVSGSVRDPGYRYED